jgi:hypothetical protein
MMDWESSAVAAIIRMGSGGSARFMAGRAHSEEVHA